MTNSKLINTILAGTALATALYTTGCSTPVPGAPPGYVCYSSTTNKDITPVVYDTKNGTALNCIKDERGQWAMPNENCVRGNEKPNLASIANGGFLDVLLGNIIHAALK